MIFATTNEIEGKQITQTLGLVRGNTVQARNVFRDIFGALKSIVGGEISEYSELMTQARDKALERLEAEALELGADAVVGVRFEAANVLQGTAEILAYGTAVKLK